MNTKINAILHTRQVIRDINNALRDNDRYVYGRLQDESWVRIVKAKSAKGVIVGQTLRGNGSSWEEINQWEQR
jgi:hypothetical protein